MTTNLRRTRSRLLGGRAGNAAALRPARVWAALPDLALASIYQEDGADLRGACRFFDNPQGRRRNGGNPIKRPRGHGAYRRPSS